MMHYRRLGRTGLKVSALCLGTMQFGWSADESASFTVMDAFAAAGGTFFDTSNIYSIGSADKYAGISEQIIGRWMQARGNRHTIVLATKARGRMWEGPTGEGLSRAHLIRACDESLRRLQTDYIDLYQAHWYDADTPIEETLETLTDLVRAGKVRYIGCSNYPAWRLAIALGTSERLHLARYDSLQPHYNLAYREEFERELQDLCADQGIGVLPYSPLAGGFLTGKYRRGDPAPASARANSIQKRYFNDHGWIVLDMLSSVAAEQSVAPAQVALAWLLARPSIIAPIIGANTPAQLSASLGAVDLSLSADQIARLDAASAWQAKG
jgi:aryl-alcohol dehydrogenase-like predicted oxidoreductase